MSTVVIDYGAGNLRSLQNSLREIGCEARLAQSPQELAGAERLILPGVGAFGDCLREIRARGFAEPVQEWLASGKPFFGICVGYQALFERSEESEAEAGLGILKGEVRHFESGAWKIPHMGWNLVEATEPESALWEGFELPSYFYFVHSYYPSLADESVAAAWTEYAGARFAAVSSRFGGVQVATQFHPEKSQANGLQLMRNWLKLTAYGHL